MHEFQGDTLDVLVVGAGMGGGVAAYALAQTGLNVLLIDRGNKTIPTPGYASTDKGEQLMAEGKWPLACTFEVDGKTTRYPVPVGSGLGGSTNLYAAALERFERSDIDAHPYGNWPVCYEELVPWYEKAERLFEVAGTADPLSGDRVEHLRSPPPLGSRDKHFVEEFEKRGMHPYRLHVGIRYKPECDECLGKLCTKACRMDTRLLLTEGIRKPTFWDRTELIKLEASEHEVQQAVLRHGDEEIRVRARVFILAAGAFHTPKVLLQSKSEHWSNGLANASGLVGKNLMVHGVINFVLWPQRGLKAGGPRKSLSLRDLYEVAGERYGVIQSLGFEMTYGMLLAYYRQVFDDLKNLRPFLRILARLDTWLCGVGTLFVCIVEGPRTESNCVVLDEAEPDGIRVKYTVGELRPRLAAFRPLLEKWLGQRRILFVSPDVELNFSHPCGTCIMSDDPKNGVVDRDCRAHGLTNLFIADASFMPTSGGVNPSLTIAANALRVSKAIIHQIEEEKLCKVQ